jgi:leader peptidase (prepilin peptidase)/N-methyltransferase
VKLAGLIGLMTGLNILIAIMITALLGGIVAVILLISKKKGRKDTVPFGPFLCVGGFVTLLYGQTILQWLVSLFPVR